MASGVVGIAVSIRPERPGLRRRFPARAYRRGDTAVSARNGTSADRLLSAEREPIRASHPGGPAGAARALRPGPGLEVPCGAYAMPRACM
ncbi:hypothetical protein Maq22A_c28015 [Methylobacterium aquaticum]|uniref:Uncharacterized protein n=1 Tax=Methylobacterium aquaticum TaxID=270351 RepID=A0A1Y0Z8L8_9HYPH|nr:hypothetical protein Maq22A_c28015 [Methylobacterium aquaticum]